ncbi:unnamed protein product [Symbiodinium microadriaticum]|nr:unnamed protein product [Symbiodinium microadriaticum]
MPSGADTVDKESVFANYKSVFSRQFAVSLAVEFLGVMFFQILGGTSDPKLAPFVNGFALAVWIYVAANISGGHLNPAVSFSTAVCGFYPLMHTVVYIVLQICGAIMGAWVSARLVPGGKELLRSGDTGPGCFDRSVIYTGAALNPARVLGPMVAFFCGTDVVGLYIAGQFTAAILAMSVFAFVSGLGPLNPYVAKKALNLSWPEATYLWITGSPPSRLQKTGRENINDFKAMYNKFYESELESDSEAPASKAWGIERLFGIKSSHAHTSETTADSA